METKLAVCVSYNHAIAVATPSVAEAKINIITRLLATLQQHSYYIHAQFCN